ncbi:MAG: hypothetical protein FD143_663 [Ignavibacteria bacterium]|nr:MAG: hypothetical protein FD143_663 [Ignavibacteria bacterium]KAF0161276.1 MAG: hypothetical protein FD188_864 [Ignavibacteria bacterium]
MNANSERIMKYLSDLMDEKDKSDFERELKTNSYLTSELNLLRDKLNDFTIADTEVDERYFSLLLPKVRSRIAKPVKSKLLPRLAFGLPTIAAVVIAGIVFVKSGFNTDKSNSDMLNEIVNNIDDEILSSKYITDLDLDVNSIFKTLNGKYESQELNYDEPTKNRILAVYDYPVNDEMLSAQQLSNEELANIYSKIVQKNY